jgi:hypothetical protein
MNADAKYTGTGLDGCHKATMWSPEVHVATRETRILVDMEVTPPPRSAQAGAEPVTGALHALEGIDAQRRQSLCSTA